MSTTENTSTTTTTTNGSVTVKVSLQKVAALPEDIAELLNKPVRYSRWGAVNRLNDADRTIQYLQWSIIYLCLIIFSPLVVMILDSNSGDGWADNAGASFDRFLLSKITLMFAILHAGVIVTVRMIARLNPEQKFTYLTGAAKIVTVTLPTIMM